MKKNSRARFLCVGIIASLLWWGAALLPSSEAVESALKVVTSPSGLTVEAHGIGAEEVLREMGEKMGFTVVAKEATHPVINVSIKDATPEEVFQQVLRGENYIVLYRRPEGEQPQGGKIDKVLLLSPPNAIPTDPNSQPPNRDQARRRAHFGEQENAPSEEALLGQATAAVFGKDGWKVIQRGEEGSPATVANRQSEKEKRSSAARQDQSEAGGTSDGENSGGDGS
ncbi:MAG TPA: hypothetical protein VGX03_08905 [Candidatus Binatia bacterium]|jgi:hypothetical protein|nr:hypothetical protein [Candidatus Binatia bacterium]